VKGSCFVLLQKVEDMGVGDFQAGFDNDIEKGFGQTPALYPGIGADENTLRWGFIRKVYGILSVQFVLTTVVAGFVVLSTPVSQFFQANPISIIVLAFLPLILLCPLYAYQQSHPLNLILLGLFTVSISLTVGISCSLAPGKSPLICTGWKSIFEGRFIKKIISFLWDLRSYEVLIFFMNSHQTYWDNGNSCFEL
jgi:hypothetical protein